jgi:HD-like signal output (HDOD) protein
MTRGQAQRFAGALQRDNDVCLSYQLTHRIVRNPYLCTVWTNRPSAYFPETPRLHQSATTVTGRRTLPVTVYSMAVPFAEMKSGASPTALLQAAESLRLAGSAAGESAQLMRLLCDAGIGADELSLRIERDVVLCARVLKIANSPYYGQQRSVTTIRRALLILGLHAVRGIVAAACLDHTIMPRVAALPDVPAVLRHSLATGIASEMLAAARAPGLICEAFIAGALHNLGTLVHAIVDPAGVRAMLQARAQEAVTKESRAIRLLEQEHCAMGHEAAIAAVFDAWQLPHSIVETARHHHRPSEAPLEHRALAGIVGTAAHLALAAGNTFSLEPAFIPAVASDPAAGLLELSPPELARLTEELQVRLSQFLSP